MSIFLNYKMSNILIGSLTDVMPTKLIEEEFVLPRREGEIDVPDWYKLQGGTIRKCYMLIHKGK